MPMRPEDVASLSPQDRLALIGQLWDSLDDPDVPLTAAQQTELARRLASFEQDRSDGTPWEVLRDELRERQR